MLQSYVQRMDARRLLILINYIQLNIYIAFRESLVVAPPSCPVFSRTRERIDIPRFRNCLQSFSRFRKESLPTGSQQILPIQFWRIRTAEHRILFIIFEFYRNIFNSLIYFTVPVKILSRRNSYSSMLQILQI